MEASVGSQNEHLRMLEKQLGDVEARLEHLYDALETGAFSSDELAPRIRKLKVKRDELAATRNRAESALQFVEQRAFLKSFVQDIQIGSDEITVNYTLPMPPAKSEKEVIGVLPFVLNGRPYRSRTCDTLIKSQGVSIKARKEVKTVFSTP